MSDEPIRRTLAERGKPTFVQEVGTKAARKLKGWRNSTPGVWFGLGMMGAYRLVGRRSDTARRGAWYLVGQTALRARIPRRWRGQRPGPRQIVVPNAWHWVAKEDKAMHEEQEGNDE